MRHAQPGAEPQCRGAQESATYEEAVQQARYHLMEQLRPGRWQNLWGHKCTKNMRNLGVYLGETALDKKGKELGRYRMDWDPTKKFHVNVERFGQEGCYYPFKAPPYQDFAHFVDKVLVNISREKVSTLPNNIRQQLRQEDCAGVCPDLKKNDQTIECPPRRQRDFI